MKMKIWTQAYRPFMMGGNVNAPITAEVEVSDNEMYVGKGYSIRTAISPKGKLFVVDVITGRIVGNDIEQVGKDISEGDENVMEKQIKDILEYKKTCDSISEEEFWNLLRA